MTNGPWPATAAELEERLRIANGGLPPATGPGGVVGSNAGASRTIPDPLTFSEYRCTIDQVCVFTMPAVAAEGVEFLFIGKQDGTGHSFTFSPAITDTPGVKYNGPVLSPNGENWLVFKSDGSQWVLFPLTSSDDNLSDLTDVDAARFNLKVPVLRHARAAATANVASLSGTTTIDTVALIADDRVLLTAQSTGAQNGPWLIKAGAWARPTDYPTAGVVGGSRLIAVGAGGANGNTLWSFGSTSNVTIDTTATTWTKIAPAAAGGGTATAVKNPWRWSGAISETIPRRRAYGTAFTLVSQQLQLCQLEYFETAVSTLDVLWALAVNNGTNGLTHHWACLIRADTNTVVATTTDLTTTAIVADSPPGYAIVGAPFTPPVDAPLWLGIAIVATSGLTSVIRGESLNSNTLTPFPMGRVTSGTGSAVTTPLTVGTVIGAPATSGGAFYGVAR